MTTLEFEPATDSPDVERTTYWPARDRHAETTDCPSALASSPQQSVEMILAFVRATEAQAEAALASLQSSPDRSRHHLRNVVVNSRATSSVAASFLGTPMETLLARTARNVEHVMASAHMPRYVAAPAPADSGGVLVDWRDLNLSASRRISPRLLNEDGDVLVLATPLTISAWPLEADEDE